MSEEKEPTLSMDETDKPELVDKPTIDHAVKDEPEAEAPAEADSKPERGPDGKFVSKTKGEEEAATPADNPIPDDQFKGYLTEKRKRQEWEERALAAEAKLAQPKPQEPPPFWDDPDKALEARMERFGSDLIQRFQQQQTLERLNASEAAARARYADYGDAFAAFQQAASANPTLVRKMTFAADPGEFAYTTGKRAMDLERVGSFEELLTQERAKWEAEVKAAVPQPSFPASTVADGSVSPRSGPVWSGPVQDKDILPMG